MRFIAISITALLGIVSHAVFASPGVIQYVSIHQVGKNVVILDTRAAKRCQHRSLAGAHCLPATDLLGPSGELPSFADIFWALGTAGLDGRETVLVAGDRRQARDFVAGVLYLCGQARVEILRPGIAKVLRQGSYPSGQGAPRAILRQRIFRTTMRDTAMVLPGELKQLRKSHLKLRYIEATQLTQGLPASGLHGTAHRILQVIYASSVSRAIASFTRMLARHSDSSKDVRVVPVPVVGQLGSVGCNTVLKPAAMSGRYRCVITKGEKLWS